LFMSALNAPRESTFLARTRTKVLLVHDLIHSLLKSITPSTWEKNNLASCPEDNLTIMVSKNLALS